MVKICFTDLDGNVHEVKSTPGQTVMEAGRNNMVPGIIGECGGCCICSTCHVYVDPEWLNAVGPRKEEEHELLEHVLHVQENSRLCCQIDIDESMDGLRLVVPPPQY